MDTLFVKKTIVKEKARCQNPAHLFPAILLTMSFIHIYLPLTPFVPKLLQRWSPGVGILIEQRMVQVRPHAPWLMLPPKQIISAGYKQYGQTMF